MATAQVAVDPVALAELAFGHDHWEVPQRILRAIFRPNARVAVKACHASSKTFASADAVLVALLLGGDVITTAPTWTQVEQVLWGAVGRAVAGGSIPLREWGQVNRTEIRLPTGEVAIGLSTDQAVRFQGYHAREDSFLLVIFDEAPGVRSEIYEAVEGIAAGGDVRRLFLGNPVIASGPFYDIFTSSDEGWERIGIDAFDTPNLRGLSLEHLLSLPESDLDVSERPYLVTRRWVRDAYRQWGEDHPSWQSRVRGAFPTQSDDTLISLAWLEQAKERPLVRDKQAPVICGIDVAGPGEDETVLYATRGVDVLGCEAWPDADPRGKVVAALRPLIQHGLKRVNVDEAGLGHYFVEHLRDVLPDTIEVCGVNVGEKPTTDDAAEQFANYKAELYWALRERFSGGEVNGLTDQTTIAQLVSIRYEHDSRGRVAIESKEKARKRGVKSPDRAEALLLALMPPKPADLRVLLAGKTMGERVR